MAVIGRWPDYTPNYTPYKVAVIERWLDYTPHKVGVLESGVKKAHCNCGGGGGTLFNARDRADKKGFKHIVGLTTPLRRSAPGTSRVGFLIKFGGLDYPCLCCLLSLIIGRLKWTLLNLTLRQFNLFNGFSCPNFGKTKIFMTFDLHKIWVLFLFCDSPS